MEKTGSLARLVFPAIGALALGGCQTVYADEQEASAGPAPSNMAHDNPLAFAQGACGGCHAVEKPWLSPNPAAPTFAEIANREGVTEATLQTYLTDAHNYPLVMDFDLDAEQAAELAHYILGLKDEDYHTPPS